jgi:hypothetical protein
MGYMGQSMGLQSTYPQSRYLENELTEVEVEVED